MGQELLVSIIVLTYKNFSGLQKTIDSILEQSYSNIEIIISDDGSENYSEDFLASFQVRASEFGKKLILKHNRVNLGTVKNINGALELIHGDVIGFLGCGDYYASVDIIQKILEEFENTGADVITCKMKGISVSNPKRISILPPKSIRRLLKANDWNKLRYKMFNENCFCAPATFYRADVYDTYGKYDERMRLIEDYPFMFRLVQNNVKISFLDIFAVDYLFDGVSTGGVNPTIASDLQKIQDFILLPNIDICRGRNKRLFLYNYKRKRCKNIGMKLSVTLKYFDQFVFWQFKRIIGIVETLRRK